MKSLTKTKTKIRVGKIRYLNCVPFYHHLEEILPSQIEFLESVPVKINQAMRKGGLDIAPISSLEYLNHREDYFLMPQLAIGSRDFSSSVLLFSRERIDGLQGAKIAVSRESLSSAALLKILLRFKYKFDNEFFPMASDAAGMLARYPAALLIGNDALFFRPEKFVYKYDLSELWWNWTEKPFCFATWAVRKDFAKRHPEEASAFFEKLQANLHRNLSNLEALVEDALQMSFMHEQFPKVFGYLFNLSYGMDKGMQEGLELFFRLAYRHGISPKPGKIEFFNPGA